MHRRGFEPLTSRFVAVYSIQLSYRCISFSKIISSFINYKKDLKRPIFQQAYLSRCSAPQENKKRRGRKRKMDGNGLRMDKEWTKMDAA